MKTQVTIGLKANAGFLFSLMNGNTLGGHVGGINHVSVVKLSTEQFEVFKTKIRELGFDVYKSLTNVLPTYGVDYSCYLGK